MEVLSSLIVDHVGGLCPVQGEGTLNGFPFYFRSRGARWSLSVALTIDSDPLDPSAWRHEEPYGEWPDAGYMDMETAQSKIEQAARLWLATQDAKVAQPA